MSEGTHKFYCIFCREFMFSESESLLAARVNQHNDTRHPSNYSSWSAKTIVASTQYTSPGGTVLQPAKEPVICTSLVGPVGNWGDAKNAPTITADDREFLEKGRIKWD